MADKYIQYAFPVEEVVDNVLVWVSDNADGVYFAYSIDEITWTYLAGAGEFLVSYGASQANAVSNKAPLSAGKNQFFFPNGIAAKYCRMYLSGSFTVSVYELVFTRMIHAEQIIATSLSAIAADLGLVVAGVVQSADWGSTRGFFIDLDNEILTIGGYENPKLSWDPVSDVLTVRGVLTGADIEAGTITADKIETALFGDLDQAMHYVKTVLAAGEEYTHDLTITDLSNGTPSDMDVDSHADYAVSLRINSEVLWDSETWDVGSWDIITKSSATWISASFDISAEKTLQMSLRYTLVEDDSTKTTETIKIQYSVDNIAWGSNSPDFNDNNWETMSLQRIVSSTYRVESTLNTFRYFKIKVELATTDTAKRIILHTMALLGNVVNVFGSLVNQVINAAGTSFTLTGFNGTPAITVTPISATPLVDSITAQNESSVTIKLFNLSGVSVGGYANITIIGT